MNPQQGSAYPPPPGQYAPAYKYDEPIDPQIPRGYPDQFDPVPQQIPQQTPQRPVGQERTLSTSSEPKQRLRKACDSCSVRKVKVSECVSIALSWTDLNSVTKVARHASLALPSKSLVPLKDQAVVADLQTDMQKPSRDRDWRMAPTSPQLGHPLTMPRTVWPPCPYPQLCLQSPSVT
jgi:hypothetical protein